MLLSRRILASWEHVLELITEKTELYTPAKRYDAFLWCASESKLPMFILAMTKILRLCTLDGRMVHAASELQDGGKYVALEGSRPFRRVAYCALERTQATYTHNKLSPQHKVPPQHKRR